MSIPVTYPLIVSTSCHTGFSGSLPPRIYSVYVGQGKITGESHLTFFILLSYIDRPGSSSITTIQYLSRITNSWEEEFTTEKFLNNDVLVIQPVSLVLGHVSGKLFSYLWTHHWTVLLWIRANGDYVERPICTYKIYRYTIHCVVDGIFLKNTVVNGHSCFGLIQIRGRHYCDY